MFNAENSATIALYSVDPVALDSFHSFDPESFSLIPLINDALVIIGLDGDVVPGLAVSWERVSPLETDFELRQGVRFHNGELMDADDVVATFAAHRGPPASACGAGILSPITDVVKIGPHRVRFTTAFPDGMLLRRLFFGQIYPKSILDSEGRDAFVEKPVGTGAYEFVHWKRGEEILLRRNLDHWANKATIDVLHFPILRQKEWTKCLENGTIDIALNTDSNQVVRSESIDGVHSASRAAALSQWFLLANKGPLADPQVRRALNHAINRTLLVDTTDHGYAIPQRTVATEEQEGFNPDVAGYRYSPPLARKLLAEAGYADGFTLKGLVSETSTSLYSTIREFLGRVGVVLEAQVLPRADWIGRVVRITENTGPKYDGDFAVANVDNPLLHSLFHQFIFLFSQGPFSLTNDPDYDQAFLRAATEVDPAKALAAQQELERYARDQALLLFTVQQQVHMVARDGFSVELPRSGHFDAAAFWSLTRAKNTASAGSFRKDTSPTGDEKRLLQATSHLGLFHLEGRLANPILDGIWRNIEASQRRWHLQMEPMIRELVSLSEARTKLNHVLDSTERVAIVGISVEGDQVLTNAGYRPLFGEVDEVSTLLGVVPDQLTWKDLRAEVVQHGSWAGPVILPTVGRPDGAPPKLYLTVTPARDSDGNLESYTLVFSDFSGEEERIRSSAIRIIQDHVVHGLFRCDRNGFVLPGYSKSCQELLKPRGEMRGRRLLDVLRLKGRERDHFSLCYEQIFDDILPEELSLEQLPSRIRINGSAISIEGAVIRDATGAVSSVLMTVADITELIEAESDAEQLKGIVQVLRFKARFKAFVTGFASDLLNLKEARRKRDIRMALHTAKGVFGQFNLHEIAAFIHEIEGYQTIQPSDLQDVYDEVGGLLRQNQAIWGIKLQSTSSALMTSQQAVAGFATEAQKATTLEELRGVVHGFVNQLQRMRVDDIIGPLADSCRLHALRRAKRAVLHVEGGDYRAPLHLAPVFGVITHLVRNAIDHGIEDDGLRGDKPDEASLWLRVAEDDSGLCISIEDDGAGIDLNALTEKALKIGMIADEELATMSHQDKCALVFIAGFTTAETVTITSGRGVGMATVQDTVDGLGGRVVVETEEGKGTKVSLVFSTESLRDRPQGAQDKGQLAERSGSG